MKTDDPIATLERELLTAARRQAARSTRAPRRWPGAAAVAASALVTVAVAGALLAAQGAEPRARPASRVPAVGAVDRQLVALLGVLRRPQTATDLSLLHDSHVIGVHFGGAVLAGSARLATITPWGKRVLLVLHARGRAASGVAPITGGLDLEADDSGSCCAQPLELLTNGMVSLVGVGRGFAGSSSAQRIYAGVPDGVARVTFISPPHRAPSGTAVYRRALRVTVPVHGNVAAAQWQRQCCSGPVMIWYAADGHLIRRIGNVRASSTLPAPGPAPETALSRRAERDPAAPNPVNVTRPVARVGPGHESAPMAATFTILVAGQSYRATMHSPAGCRTVTRTFKIEPVLDVRGQRFSDALTPPGRWHWCPGSYAVSIAVLGRDRGRRRITAPPFGTGRFTIRR